MQNKSFQSKALVCAAIATLITGCASGSGGQLPPTTQPLSDFPNARQADANVASIDAPLPSTCTWSVVPSTNWTTGNQNLFAVDASSSSDAWAVGQGPSTKSLALHWNGATWTQSSTPAPLVTNKGFKLTAVSEVAPNDVWAMGYYKDSSLVVHTLAEHFDGTHWTIVPMPPTPAGDRGLNLDAVKMITHANGWAVGSEYTASSNRTVIEHWDGISWTRVPSPNASTNINELDSLAVISPTNIWASGTAFQLGSIVLHYDGNTWALVRTVPASLEALAAASTSEIFDVGYYQKGSINQTYAEEYFGTTFLQQATPNAGADTTEVFGAAAVSTNEVFAVGYHHSSITSLNKPFAMMWNGTSWVLGQPRSVASDVLNAVTAIPGTKDAFAVGLSFNNTSGDYKTLTERVHCL
jgi:hypothetical protein